MSRSDELLRDLCSAWPADLPPVRASVDEADRVAYSRDLWPRHHMEVRSGQVGEHRPAVVVWPGSTREVAAIVCWAARTRTPLVPFGAGSGVCGGVLPDAGTVVVDMKRMARWRALDTSAPSLDVEAGALGLPLEDALGRQGFTLGHFPSSILCSTVGGWVAARSAGQCSGYYGKIEDMVTSVECVLGDGESVTLHARPHGPDLTPLVVGSEGIFGVVTSATLRLHPVPETRAFGAFTFPETAAGWDGMRQVFQAGLRPAVSRLYDPFDAMLARMGGVKARRAGHEPVPARAPRERAPGLGTLALRTVLRRPFALNELIERAGGRALGGAMLVVIFEGGGDAPGRDMRAARDILESSGGRYDGEDAARRWLAHRYAVSYRQSPIYTSGAWVDTMEVAATWSRLGAVYDAVRAALGDHVFVMAHLSHAYPDGCCIYFSFAGSSGRGGGEAGAWDSASLETYERAWQAALAAAESAGGPISHHHGVGRSKAPRLARELSGGIGVVRALKRAFDPIGVLNPGNLIPDGVAEPRASPKPSEGPELDSVSMLVRVGGQVALGTLEAWLVARGLTLDVAGALASAESVDDWVGGGASGARAPWRDPADHLIAGFTARFVDGQRVEVRPAPRRAVGPDLLALVSGHRGRLAVLESAWLRVHAVGGRRGETAPFAGRVDVPLNVGETMLLDRVASCLLAARTHRPDTSTE